MWVYPNKEFGIRPRKAPQDIFRKQNYWIQGNQEPPPWYVWDTKLPITRSKSEERPAVTKNAEEDSNIIANDLRTYLLTSTLHGLRYIGERKLTWFERFFWLAAFGCSLVCSGFFILNVYAKWRSSPMIVSINPQNMQLEELPFPALTICNVNQAKKTVAERYIKNGTSVDRKLLQSLCSTREDSDMFEDDITGSANWDHTRQFLINVTQPCSEMIVRCIWDSITMNCEDLFNAQLTDEGLCCTFNAVHRNKMFRNPGSLNDMNITFPLPAVDWTPEDGYPPDSPPDGFPWRPKGIGTNHGLSLVLDANLAEYYCASTKSAGFKILMHNPTETPKIKNLGDIYAPGIEARVAICPKILDAQSALRTIDIKKRVCLFSSEKELVFFRTYTLKNCEMECEARAMLNVCNCVFYYMPSFHSIEEHYSLGYSVLEILVKNPKLGTLNLSQKKELKRTENKTTRICGKTDSKCYTNMSIIMPDGRDISCEECMPACTEIGYVERMSWAPLKRSLIMSLAKSIENRTAEYFTHNMLLTHFYFEENTFLRFTKGEIFGLTEFLSNTGGLLGLCMGFSMMSAVELIYFLSLRALCMARQRRPRQPFVE